MNFNKKKFIIFKLIFFVIVLLYFASNGTSAVFLEYEVVSGKLLSVARNIIKLEGNEVFYPAPSLKNTKVSLIKGSDVSLKYYEDTNANKIYFEFTPGKDKFTKTLPIQKRGTPK